MEIVEFKDYTANNEAVAIALGNFDGLHLGHQELVKKVVLKADEKNIIPSILLFKEHTKAIIKKEKPKMLTNNKQKYKILEEMGIKRVFLIDFDENLMKLSPEEFIKKILVDKLNVDTVVVGFDYRFGHKASGNTETLLDLSSKYNLDVEIVQPIELKDIVIGSSNIRSLIEVGNVKKAMDILGRPYSIIGRVIPGMNRGNKLGFPTANVDVNQDYAVPKDGVYKTKTIVGGREYLSATNIGVNPTFNENELKIETHILDFNENIYDNEIEIVFLDFIRDDIKFQNKEDLIDQMEKDIKIIRGQ